MLTKILPVIVEYFALFFMVTSIILTNIWVIIASRMLYATDKLYRKSLPRTYVGLSLFCVGSVLFMIAFTKHMLLYIEDTRERYPLECLSLGLESTSGNTVHVVGILIFSIIQISGISAYLIREISRLKGKNDKESENKKNKLWFLMYLYSIFQISILIIFMVFLMPVT